MSIVKPKKCVWMWNFSATPAIHISMDTQISKQQPYTVPLWRKKFSGTFQIAQDMLLYPCFIGLGLFYFSLLKRSPSNRFPSSVSTTYGTFQMRRRNIEASEHRDVTDKVSVSTHQERMYSGDYRQGCLQTTICFMQTNKSFINLVMDIYKSLTVEWCRKFPFDDFPTELWR